MIAFFSPWTWRMAWRDSRTSRRKLLLYASSIVLGVAALTGVGSLGKNLERAIAEQAKGLLGADLVLNSRQAFGPQHEALFRRIGGEQSREVAFSSMVYFPRTEGTRLVQVRALEGGFPYYGALQTDPPEAVRAFRRGGGALVEDALMTQFGARVGDQVRLGELNVPIIGRLQKVPGETVAFATIAPRVYINMSDLPRTGLMGEGSLVRYRVYFKLPPQVDPEALERQLRPDLDELRLSCTTVAERTRDLGRAMDNLYYFLNLVGFIALLLGGVGVASGIHVHIKQKLGTVAVLRCLGGTIGKTFSIYLAQGIALGAFGALAGAGLGIGIGAVLPRVLSDFIPFAFDFRTSWSAIAMGAGIGFAVCLLFTLFPLLTVRKVSPLAALRVAVEQGAAARDPLRWLAGLLLAGGVLAFALNQARNWRFGLSFAVGLGVVFLLLALTAKVLMLLVRRFTPKHWPFPIRQGLGSLHRPNNRTVSLLLALGLGTFLIMSLFLVQHSLVTQLVSGGPSGEANAVLFDIQPDQRDGIRQLVRSLKFPIVDEAPIVTMRISSVKGRSVEAMLADRRDGVPNWPLRREYRSTYNDRLRDGEKLIAGKWHGSETNVLDPAPISLEQGIARDLKVGLGDEVVFDVQGVPINATVASLREVDWRRVQPNFFVVFPPGVLEAAPAMHVLVTKVQSAEESARLQREVVKQFPNVSAIDLSLILNTLDSILSKISFVIRFMAMFTVITGLFVVAAALVTTRYQRVQESVLLRTLGASRRQISSMLVVEYVALGLLAAVTGVALAIAAAWGLAHFVFKIEFSLSVRPVIATLVAIPLITLISGLLTNRGVTRHPPLAILRAEG